MNCPYCMKRLQTRLDTHLKRSPDCALKHLEETKVRRGPLFPSVWQVPAEEAHRDATE